MPPQAPPSGYYAAPPQSGVLQGPSRAVEIEGAALRFPALELKLPSLRLPCCSKIQSNARMLIESAQAPYVQQPPVALGAPIAIQQVAAPPQAPPQQSPPQAPPEQAPPQYGPPYAPPSCDAPRMPPRCDAAMIELQQQLQLRDQKIEQLNQQITRMASSMERLTQVIDQLAVQPGENRPASRSGNNATNQLSSRPAPSYLPAPLAQQTPAIRLSGHEEEIRTDSNERSHVLLQWQKPATP
jgi:hypothetical protein